MREYSQLKKINVLVKLQHGVSDKQTRWVKDSPYKIAACYLACKLTPFSDREIAGFFDINAKFMRSEVERYAVHLLLDTEAKKFMQEMETAYKELEAIYV
jgi:hypothetical protein